MVLVEPGDDISVQICRYRSLVRRVADDAGGTTKKSSWIVSLYSAVGLRRRCCIGGSADQMQQCRVGIFDQLGLVDTMRVSMSLVLITYFGRESDRLFTLPACYLLAIRRPLCL